MAVGFEKQHIVAHFAVPPLPAHLSETVSVSPEPEADLGSPAVPLVLGGGILELSVTVGDLTPHKPSDFLGLRQEVCRH